MILWIFCMSYHFLSYKRKEQQGYFMSHIFESGSDQHVSIFRQANLTEGRKTLKLFIYEYQNNQLLIEYSSTKKSI